MKKVLLILICACMLLSSCDAEPMQENVIGAYADKEQESEEYVSLSSITMLYYPDMDTNPATTNCLANHELLKYVYSPLITVNDSFDPICVLADSFSRSGNVVTVKLRQDIVFSNGEKVTANDAVRSFNAVKSTPTSPYYSSVERMHRYYATDESTLVCEFDYHDVDCVSMLDIPIMYQGKEGYGCGAYVFSEQNGKPVLIPNERYTQKATVPLIRLVETKNDDYIDDLFSSGALDVMISSAVNELSLTSLRDYQIVSCPSNRLVYIGVNFADPVFSSIEVRRAISTVIDRADIAEQSLVGLASPTEYPFNPEWSKMKTAGADAPTKSTDEQILAAMALLQNTPLTLTVPTGGYKQKVAATLVEEFRAAGLTLNLRELDAASYTAAITAGDFALYLGETAVPRNMDPTALYSTGGAMNYGGYADYELDSMFDRYKTGSVELKSYLEVFSERLPIIPLLFNKSVLYCADGIEAFDGCSAFATYGNGAGLKLK